jgi:3-hydroxyacyl-CoA dehydrogenase
MRRDGPSRVTRGAAVPCRCGTIPIPPLPPASLTPEESARKLTLDTPEVRNRIARAGLEAAKKSRPAAFFAPEGETSCAHAGGFDGQRRR